MRKYFFLILIIIKSISLLSQNHTVGWFLNDSIKSYEGYTLFAPITYNKTFLIDNCGSEVHNWISNYTASAGVYLLDDGTLLRSGKILNSNFIIGGQGGIIERHDWESHLLWSYHIESDSITSHHDFKYLSNGNILLLIWRYYLKEELIESGRNPDITGGDLSMEEIWEINPLNNDSAEIVWQWKAKDHLIQDFDAAKPNFGNPSEHPELINFNYIGTGPPERSWLHFNSIDFDEETDQILISVRNFNEIWILDHSTTTEEAAGHSGGLSGKGGDLLFRWGNPAAYNRGTAENQKLFSQHNAQRIKNSLPDENKIMIFNNGLNRPTENYSSVDIIVPETDINGNYLLGTDNTFLPDTFFNEITTNNPLNLYSQAMGSAQRLVNGNTLICEANTGRILEIEPYNNDIVFEYINPVDNNGPVAQGTVLSGTNSIFQAIKYSPDFSGFSGHDLISGDPIEINPLNYDCESTVGSVKEKLTEKSFEIFPNPANIFFRIISLSENKISVKLILTDVTGIIKMNTNINKNQSIDVSSLKDGFYFVKIYTENKEFTYKIIINH